MAAIKKTWEIAMAITEQIIKLRNWPLESLVGISINPKVKNTAKLIEGIKKHISIVDNISISEVSILIAYSGGVDSSVLLDIVNSLSNEMKFKYDFVYINHNMNENSNHIREFADKFSKKNKTNFIYHEIKKNHLKTKNHFFENTDIHI